MTVHDPKQLHQVDRDIRLNELAERAKEFDAGRWITGKMTPLPQDAALEFWENVGQWESEPDTTLMDELKTGGLELPEPASLDDADVTRKLYELVDQLAHLGVTLSQTDHLSDRQLYRQLWSTSLRDPIRLLAGWSLDLDMLGAYGEDEIETYLKYYADEAHRRTWAAQWPDDEIPDHVDPPFDRDRFLP